MLLQMVAEVPGASKHNNVLINVNFNGLAVFVDLLNRKHEDTCEHGK